MPKRTDIETIAIIGAGPIVIGQACEFDYSGVQACKALKQEGYRVILVNSNPATIMTDPGLADATYIEPITADVVEKVLEQSRPDALLPTMGGQTALNVAFELDRSGVLARLGIEMIGADAEAIAKAEDRLRFREAMDRIGLDSPRSRVARSLRDARSILKETGLPAIIRPSYTLGGAGGGIAYNLDDFEAIVRNGLRVSPVSEVLVEESVLGWKEFEMEVVRDRADNCIIVCSIENVDPMGVHTGDSITVAPALTLTDKEYQIMRNASIAVLREIGVDTGGSNVQFAVEPESGRLVVIEMNPRVSRSSALASKATGFPIAKVAAKLAVGYTLDELDNDITGVTPASFEPTIDYVVTKIPRFTFEKFPKADNTLTTSMKSVGEAMAIGRSFSESVQKALRSLETGLTGFNRPKLRGNAGRLAVQAALSKPTAERLLIVAEAFRHGMPLAEIQRLTSYDPWFLARIREIVDAEARVIAQGLPTQPEDWAHLKSMGFSDARLGELAMLPEGEVTARRHAARVAPVYKRIDTCAAEFASRTPYMYSTYEADCFGDSECEADPSDRRKVIILGGGPNRIGQGIEFDYCCVHAAYALREAGIETVMVNCNPETVSTDYDTSDRLYFEPLTVETVADLVRVEQRCGTVLGLIVQFGGQTPLRLANDLARLNIPILGTPPDAIDLAEDRERFQHLLNRLGLRQPANGLARSREQAELVAAEIGYPVVIRPSYVLGGRAMEIVHDADGLQNYIQDAVVVSGNNPVLIDRYLQNAIEIDVDVIADGSGPDGILVAGIMEHIEEAGIHSGDSACSLPAYTLGTQALATVHDQARRLAEALGVVGLMNVQFAYKGNELYVLEVNPRASRTVPFVAKATGVPIAKIAARLMAGEYLTEFALFEVERTHVAVKEAVFPFNRFPGVEILLGPEMRSTGEVMGLDRDFGRAFAKSQLAAGTRLPARGTAFLSVKDNDKDALVPVAKDLRDLGFQLLATAGTAEFLERAGVSVQRIKKVLEGHPHVVDAMINGEVDIVINTAEGALTLADANALRQVAVANRIPYYTTVSGARAAVSGIEAIQKLGLEVAPLQTYITRSY